MPFVPFDAIPVRDLTPKIHGRYLHAERMTIGHVVLDPGASLPEHAHPHEQLTHVLSGEMDLTIDGVRQTLKPGLVAVIPGNAKHSARSDKGCVVLDIFNPVREDYR